MDKPPCGCPEWTYRCVEERHLYKSNLPTADQDTLDLPLAGDLVKRSKRDYKSTKKPTWMKDSYPSIPVKTSTST